MRVVGYLRVSTDQQAEEGYGLDIQERAIRKWAEDNHHELVAIMRDEGVSGTKDIAEREGLEQALSMVEAGDAEGLVVYRLDRLARTLNIQEAAFAHVWRAGGQVFSVDIGEIQRDDPDDPMRTAMRQMMGVFAQLERGMIRARLRSGRRRKREEGGYIGGPPPFGFYLNGGELVEDTEEQLVIQRIRQLHHECKSLREIGRALEAEGFRPKRGRGWHHSTINRALQRVDS